MHSHLYNSPPVLCIPEYSCYDMWVKPFIKKQKHMWPKMKFKKEKEVPVAEKDGNVATSHLSEREVCSNVQMQQFGLPMGATILKNIPSIWQYASGVWKQGGSAVNTTWKIQNYINKTMRLWDNLVFHYSQSWLVICIFRRRTVIIKSWLLISVLPSLCFITCY